MGYELLVTYWNYFHLDHLQVLFYWTEWHLSLTFFMRFYWDPKENSLRFVEMNLGPCQTSTMEMQK